MEKKSGNQKVISCKGFFFYPSVSNLGSGCLVATEGQEDAEKFIIVWHGECLRDLCSVATTAHPLTGRTTVLVNIA